MVMKRNLRQLSSWYFLIAFVAATGIFVFSYRNNNLTALRLRDQLLADDKAGLHVEKSLGDLRGYIYSHMNANLSGGPGSIYPPIQLTGTYQRAVEQAKQRADAANAQAKIDAVAACEAQFPGRRTGYLLCLQNYEAAHTAVPQTIPDSLYKFDFVAPTWSPDKAGWSLVAAALFLMLFLIRFVAEIWLRHSLQD